MHTSDLPLRDRLLMRWSALKSERASWMAHWQEISNVTLPRSGRYTAQDRNKGTKRHNTIYDNTSIRALRILGAGMMSGATSPARPWFRLRTADRNLRGSAAVKVWMADATQLILDVFAASNTYRALHTLYQELGAFGTAAAIVLEDYENVIHLTPMTVGEYALATDFKGNVDTLYREFQKTVGDIVEEFGYDNCSIATQAMYDSRSYDTWVTLLHAIEPRSMRDYDKADARNMKFRSCYLEVGQTDNKLLRESGYRSFRVLAPRWDVTGGDIYGSSPGMEALGDIKQLQHQQLRKAECIDYQTRPPLQAPVSYKNQDIRMVPGGVAYVDATSPAGGIRTAFEVNLNLQHLAEDMAEVRNRINAAFYADLFLMLANDTRSGVTATEIAERHEEKMLMIGPTLERLHNELLQPLVHLTFERLAEVGALPSAPPELKGREIEVEFTSLLAQAQRAVATAGIDKFVGNLGGIARFKPEVLDKFDSDAWADEYSEMLGVDPRLVVPTEVVLSQRQQRAQAQMQAQQAQATAQMMQQQAATAKTLGATPTKGGASTALDDVLGAVRG